MEINILYRCTSCKSEMVAGVTGQGRRQATAPAAIECLVCSGEMTPQGELSPEQAAA